MNMLQIGSKGNDVREIQIALCGFDGGVFDGDFGPATRMQVRKFQRDFMRVQPSGKVDSETVKNIIAFGKAYPLNWNKVKCDCGQCDGFGNNKNLNVYRDRMPKFEAYYLYEYPGIHRAIQWLSKAVMFHCRNHYTIQVNSGYRCSVNNKIHGRTSTNHHGKSVDLWVTNGTPENRESNTDHAKKIIAINCSIQEGWMFTNKKSLEPKKYGATTWIHLDVRSFESKFLKDEFFEKDQDAIYKKMEGVLNAVS